MDYSVCIQHSGNMSSVNRWLAMYFRPGSTIQLSGDMSQYITEWVIDLYSGIILNYIDHMTSNGW
jgi:hypothetical protein